MSGSWVTASFQLDLGDSRKFWRRSKRFQSANLVFSVVVEGARGLLGGIKCSDLPTPAGPGLAGRGRGGFPSFWCSEIGGKEELGRQGATKAAIYTP